MKPTIDDLYNVLEFSKQVLSFYENENNYKEKNSKILILVDKGSQAKFALKRINEILSFRKKLVDDFLNINDPLNEELSLKNMDFDSIQKLEKISEMIKIFNKENK